MNWKLNCIDLNPIAKSIIIIIIILCKNNKRELNYELKKQPVLIHDRILNGKQSRSRSVRCLTKLYLFIYYFSLSTRRPSYRADLQQLTDLFLFINHQFYVFKIVFVILIYSNHYICMNTRHLLISRITKLWAHNLMRIYCTRINSNSNTSA